MAAVEADAQPVDFAQLKEDFRRHGAPAAQGLLRIADALEGLIGGLGGAIAMGPGGAMRLGGEAPAAELAPPPPPALIDAVEAQIGRRLPEELRQLYAIGDGGFGPGQGLFAICELGRRYVELTREPFGPMGQDWPENLVPLFDDDPALVCLDCGTGEVIGWDPEEIEDEESEADWQRSFKREHASLAELMEHWLAEPTFEEQAARTAAQAAQSASVSPVTGWPVQLEDPAQQAEAEIGFLKASPELRRDFGLPETGWEDEIRRRYSLD